LKSVKERRFTRAFLDLAEETGDDFGAGPEALGAFAVDADGDVAGVEVAYAKHKRGVGFAFLSVGDRFVTSLHELRSPRRM
jgi:hypothetical protein